MTRHRRQRERLVSVGRTSASAVLILAGLGIIFAWPAESPITPSEAGSASGRLDDQAATSRPPSSPTPTLTLTPSATPRATADTPAEPTVDERAELEDEVARLTNDEREAAGCDPVRTDDRLRAAARGHSEDMRERKYFSHSSPEGVKPWDRAATAGYDHPASENIAWGYRDAAAVVAAWMDSDGHRANILNCEVKATGVGVALSGAGPYWTQMFGYE